MATAPFATKRHSSNIAQHCARFLASSHSLERESLGGGEHWGREVPEQLPECTGACRPRRDHLFVQHRLYVHHIPGTVPATRDTVSVLRKLMIRSGRTRKQTVI